MCISKLKTLSLTHALTRVLTLALVSVGTANATPIPDDIKINAFAVGAPIHTFSVLPSRESVEKTEKAGAKLNLSRNHGKTVAQPIPFPASLVEKNVYHFMLDTGEVRELPFDAKQTYFSSDEKVATLADGKIRGVSSGDCTIYTQAGKGKKIFALVTVDWPVQNPVLPYAWQMNIPDCEAHTFNGKLHVYGSLDASVNQFCSPCLTPVVTSDLRRWENHGIAFSSYDKTQPYPKRILWGADVHFYRGKYRLYGSYEWFGAKTRNHSYVVESDKPTGPFNNFRWVREKASKKEIEGITAKVYVEKDGTRYLIWAPTEQPTQDNHLLVAKLIDHDAIDEKSVHKIGGLKDFYEGPSIRKRGDIYYLIYDENCGPITKKNHTPKRLSYATSKKIDGDYIYRGVILSIEEIPGNINIQGSIEEFNGKWYVFYHKGLNNTPFKRALCIERIDFDENGLIKPVVTTSSGIAEGLDTSKPIYFNTAVVQKNFTFNNEGAGRAVIKRNAEIGFRYILFTGEEKTVEFRGAGLEKITSVKIIANGEIIGKGTGGSVITLKSVKPGKAAVTILVKTNGTVRLETLHFKR